MGYVGRGGEGGSCEEWGGIEMSGVAIFVTARPHTYANIIKTARHPQRQHKLAAHPNFLLQFYKRMYAMYLRRYNLKVM